MSQALHIFRKDTRRFWAQILAVATLFAIYAVLSPETELSGVSSLLEWGSLLSVLIVLACWTLSAAVVHEDAPAQSSPFWLTRPYGRGSLLAAKILFLIAFVFLPLLITCAVLEARSGVSVPAHAGTLLELCIVRSGWLILPALALSAVTRNLTEFVSGACTLLLVLTVAEARAIGHGVNISALWHTTNILALLPMILAAAGVLFIQYAIRRTQWSRSLLLAAVIVSGLLMPGEGVALLSKRVMNPGFQPDRIRLSFDERMPPETEMIGRNSCWSVLIRQEGLEAGMALRPLRADSSFDSTTTRKPSLAILEDAEGGYREIVCGLGPPPPSRNNPVASERVTLRTTVDFAVISVSQIAVIPVKRGTLDAGVSGRCEIITPFPNTQLRCNLAEPVAGSITAGLEYPGYRSFSAGFGDNSALRLNPVLRQKFTGDTQRNPVGWPLEEVLERGDGRIELRTERVIGYLRRDLIYQGIAIPWSRWMKIPAPPPPPARGR